jgi:hypothetical protein
LRYNHYASHDRVRKKFILLIIIILDELAVTYAALILHDDGHAVTADKLDKLVKAAGVEVAPYWGMLFERVLKERNLDDLILNGGGAPAAGKCSHQFIVFITGYYKAKIQLLFQINLSFGFGASFIR